MVRRELTNFKHRSSGAKWARMNADLDLDPCVLQGDESTLLSLAAGIESRSVLVRRHGSFLGLLGLADTSRPGMRAVLDRLASLGVRQTIMLTGDNEQVAKAVAASVGITDVRAGLMPEEKLQIVGALMREHGQVAMVGDDVNDAPAMARATMGIAMGAAGTDVAPEAAHEGATVLVVVNALRLLRYADTDNEPADLLARLRTTWRAWRSPRN
jgi:cation transport ATPase